MTARDIHGRRGGRCAPAEAGQLPQAVTEILAAGRGSRRAVDLDPAQLFHPEAIAKARAHQRSCTHGRNEDCPAQAEPHDLAALWAGRARMARARLAARQPLDDIDRQALQMHPTGEAAT